MRKFQPGNLSNSARTSVLAQLRLAKPQITRGKWLSPSNSAYGGEYSFCRASNQQCVEYISSAGILHLYDGWCYLGNALRALVKNEPFVIGHLAYYAELRAAMSLLASMGVVNFGEETFCVDKAMRIRRIPSLGGDIKGTHKVVWKRLEDAFSTQMRPPEFMKLHELFQIEGLSLEEWVNGLSGGCSGLSIVSGYIKEWGIDIKNYDGDRKARNKLSYDISFYQKNQRNTHEEVVAWLSDFWSCFESIGAKNFLIDYYMLWVILQSVRKAKNWDEKAYKTKLEEFLRTTSMSESSRDRCVAILTRTPGQFGQLLSLSRTFALTSNRYYLHIMSRALILLRIATIACGDAFKNAGLRAADLTWWINGGGKEKGLWNEIPEDFSTLYEDVENALEELKTRTVTTYSDFLLNSFNSESNPFPRLGFSEYAMLWGLPS